jgi:phosphatidylserine decarboxylase
MLTRFGFDNILIMIIAGIGFIAISFYISNIFPKSILIILGLILIIMAFVFFRDPDRRIPDAAIKDLSLVLSPADGKIMEVVEIEEPFYMKEKTKRISIFLSPLDVHVNRTPVTGVVEYYEYKTGKFMAAFEPKSSELNEHSKIGVKTIFGKILFKQIVGALARRIVCELKVGDSIKAGDKIGMMKFGSRMDVFLPVTSEIFIKSGNKVVAGESIIAKIK